MTMDTTSNRSIRIQAEKVRDMKFDSLISILEKQLTLYMSLYQLAVRKVDMIKTNDISSLNQIMKEEQKHITAISALENERIKDLQKRFPKRETVPTISSCIEVAESEQKPILEDLFRQLTNILQKIKEQNDLNQELIKQSLQFVNYSLNLFQPRSNAMNYGPKAEDQSANATEVRSLFNSQV